MWSRLSVPVRLFVLLFIQSGVITVNMRAIAQGRYAESFVSDLILYLMGFTIVKQIVEANTKTAQFCYALGGATGAQVAIWATKILFGE